MFTRSIAQVHARVTLNTVSIATGLITSPSFHDPDASLECSGWVSTFLLKSSILLVCTKDGIHPMPGAASCTLDSLAVFGTTPFSSFSTVCTHIGGSGVNASEPWFASGTNGGVIPTPTAGNVQGNGEAVVWFPAAVMNGKGATLPKVDKLETGSIIEKLEIGPRLDKLAIGANVTGGKVGNNVARVVVFVVDVDVVAVEVVAVEVLVVLVAVVCVSVTVVDVVVVVDVYDVEVAVVNVEVVPVEVLVVEIVDVVAVSVVLVVVGDWWTSISDTVKLAPPMLQYCTPPHADLSNQCVSPFHKDDTRTKPPLAMASATFFAALSGTPVPMGFPPRERLNSMTVSLSWLRMTVMCPLNSKDEVTLKGLEESMTLAPGL